MWDGDAVMKSKRHRRELTALAEWGFHNQYPDCRVHVGKIKYRDQGRAERAKDQAEWSEQVKRTKPGVTLGLFNFE